MQLILSYILLCEQMQSQPNRENLLVLKYCIVLFLFLDSFWAKLLKDLFVAVSVSRPG